MPAPETARHVRLKALALAWARANGFAIGACEVRVPRSGFRADGAACGRGPDARTAVFECKQARADLLKDAQAEEGTRRRLAELTARRQKLEEMFTVHRPDLRRGESLFPEYDALDISQLEHRTYRAVLKQLSATQARVLKGTKFAKMYRYRCADFLYLVVEDNIFAEAEIPAGWGLLVRQGAALTVARPPLALAPTPAQRQALLENIALAATRVVHRALGIGSRPRDWTSAEIPGS